jgi:very-short-patch-repair endonuclease
MTNDLQTKKLVRLLRKNQTKSECLLWEALKNRNLNDFKFIRQYPILLMEQNIKFVADFYCAKRKLIIELDGEIHEKQIEYDEYRTSLLNLKGYTVLRFKNDLVENNIAEVLLKIKSYL